MSSDDPARIDLGREVRSISFENPTGARSAAGQAHGGRKGAANRILEPGERVTLADIEGPGRVHHVWLTIPLMPPEQMRGVWLEVFYDDAALPSIATPCLDFFASPHGRPCAFSSALVAVQEGRGFNSWIPMPFRRRLRMELTNGAGRRIPLYYQISLSLGEEADDVGLLHASFRRENPTTLGRDFVIADDLAGPGRFLGMSVGIRVRQEPPFSWYGEGEVKMFLDEDGPYPSWCGTGLEDYVGSAWGLGAHHAPYQGAPLIAQAEGSAMPSFVGLYRWHLPDPIVFRERIRVTLQQLGAVPVPRGETHIRRALEADQRVAGGGFFEIERGPLEAFGVCERQDDVCATAFVYCRDPQPVPRLDLASAVADLEREPWEAPSSVETMLDALLG